MLRSLSIQSLMQFKLLQTSRINLALFLAWNKIKMEFMHNIINSTKLGQIFSDRINMFFEIYASNYSKVSLSLRYGMDKQASICKNERNLHEIYGHNNKRSVTQLWENWNKREFTFWEENLYIAFLRMRFYPSKISNVIRKVVQIRLPIRLVYNKQRKEDRNWQWIFAGLTKVLSLLPVHGAVSSLYFRRKPNN